MLKVDAIDVALGRMRAPQGASSRQLQLSPLPNNMSDLVRLAAEQKDTVERYVEQKNLKAEQLVEAAQLYLQNLILNSGEDAHKTLGLKPGATAAEIKDHKRMLLKWLHPDLNKNRWQSALFNRVQTASERLQSTSEAASVQAEGMTPSRSAPGATRSRRRAEHQRALHASNYKRNVGRRTFLLRNVALPAMAIAVGAVMIYLVNTQTPAGHAFRNSVQSWAFGKSQ